MNEQLISAEQSEPTQVYKKCYVAFLDILGYKNYIKETDPNEILKNIETFIFGTESNHFGLKRRFGITGEDVNILCISDSIIISIEKEKPCALDAIAWLCGASQMQLLLHENLLMRGAISFGDFYMNEHNRINSTILFGKAYNDAYALEEKTVIYPRIIIDENTIDSFDGKSSSSFLKCDPHDGCYFVDYLRHIDDPDETNDLILEMKHEEGYVDNVRGKLEKARKYIDDMIEKGKTMSIKMKYRWTKNYIGRFLKENPQYDKTKPAEEVNFNGQA